MELIQKQGRLAIPVGFLRRAFIDSPEAAGQFAANASPHFAAVYELNKTLNKLIEKGGPLDRLHILSEQIVGYYYTRLRISENQLKDFNALHRRIRDLENSAVDEAQKVDLQVRDQVLKNMHNLHKAVDDALGDLQQVLQKLLALQKEKQKIEKGVAKDLDDLRHLADPPCGQIDTGICNIDCRICPLGVCFDEPGCALARLSCRTAGRHLKWVCQVHASRPGLQEAVRIKQAAEDKVAGDITKAMQAFKDTAAKVHAAIEAYYKSEGDMLHASIDLAQRFHKDVNPIRGIFSEWLDDNGRAMEAYFVSNGTAIYNSVTRQNALEPLKIWMQCWAPALVGAPSQAPQAGCAIRSAYNEIKKALDALEKLAIVNVPILTEVRLLKQQIENAIKEVLTQELYRFGERVTGVDIQHLLAILASDSSKAILDAEFMLVPASKALLAFDRLSDRIDSEMYLVDEKFDAFRYAVIYDAVVLAKLSLLDAEGLNLLAGKMLYSGADFPNSNVMPRLASSIDGDYQWMADSPPYARSDGASTGPSHYGYPEGWPFWKDIDLRKNVFRELFQTPLSPGLHTPQDIGLSPVLPPGYPYDPTEKCPFPTYPRAPTAKPCD